MGVFNTNETINVEVIQLMEMLHKFVPGARSEADLVNEDLTGR